MKRSSALEHSFPLLLTMAAGFVDAYVYMHAKAFPANMTGNTVILAIAFGKGNLAGILIPAISILGFVAGTVLASLFSFRKLVSALPGVVMRPILLLEALILVLAAVCTQPLPASQSVLLVLGSVAMGMQGVAMGQLGIKGVSTITITNTLTTGISNLVYKGMAVMEHKPSSKFSPSLQLKTWVVYLASAGVAAWMVNRQFRLLLLIPALIVVAGLFVYRSERKPELPAPVVRP